MAVLEGDWSSALLLLLLVVSLVCVVAPGWHGQMEGAPTVCLVAVRDPVLWREVR